MKDIYSWKKGFLSCICNIYSSGKEIGTLKDKAFSQTSEGEIMGDRYSFKTTGIFNQKTAIIDIQNNKIIGNITYNSWMTKATINLFDKIATFKYDNVWNTKWSVIDDQGNRINYAGYSTSGKIESSFKNDLLLLTGLFITNYYAQMSIAVMLIVFIPIWV